VVSRDRAPPCAEITEEMISAAGSTGVVEITSAMTAAGIEEFFAHSGLSDSPEEAVSAIFKAMVLASRESSSPDQKDRPFY